MEMSPLALAGLDAAIGANPVKGQAVQGFEEALAMAAFSVLAPAAPPAGGAPQEAMPIGPNARAEELDRADAQEKAGKEALAAEAGLAAAASGAWVQFSALVMPLPSTPKLAPAILPLGVVSIEPASTAGSQPAAPASLDAPATGFSSLAELADFAPAGKVSEAAARVAPAGTTATLAAPAQPQKGEAVAPQPFLTGGASVYSVSVDASQAVASAAKAAPARSDKGIETSGEAKPAAGFTSAQPSLSDVPVKLDSQASGAEAVSPVVPADPAARTSQKLGLANPINPANAVPGFHTSKPAQREAKSETPVTQHPAAAASQPAAAAFAAPAPAQGGAAVQAAPKLVPAAQAQPLAGAPAPAAAMPAAATAVPQSAQAFNPMPAGRPVLADASRLPQDASITVSDGRVRISTVKAALIHPAFAMPDQVLPLAAEPQADLPVEAQPAPIALAAAAMSGVQRQVKPAQPKPAQPEPAQNEQPVPEAEDEAEDQVQAEFKTSSPVQAGTDLLVKKPLRTPMTTNAAGLALAISPEGEEASAKPSSEAADMSEPAAHAPKSDHMVKAETGAQAQDSATPALPVQVKKAPELKSSEPTKSDPVASKTQAPESSLGEADKTATLTLKADAEKPMKTVAGSLPEPSQTPPSLPQPEAPAPASFPKIDSPSPMNQMVQQTPAESAKPVAQAERVLNEALAAGRSGTTTIRLNPGELGSITVTVRNKGRKIEAEISASNSDVRTALASSRADLAQAMEAKGHSLSSLTVTTERNRVETAPQPAPQPEAPFAGQDGQDRQGRQGHSHQEALKDQIRQTRLAALHEGQPVSSHPTTLRPRSAAGLDTIA